jgi:hypothetical protein
MPTSSSSSVNCRQQECAPLALVHAASLAFTSVRFAQENFRGKPVCNRCLRQSPMRGLSRYICKKRRWGAPLPRHLTPRRHCARHHAGFLNEPTATAANWSSRTPQSCTRGPALTRDSSSCDSSRTRPRRQSAGAAQNPSSLANTARSARTPRADRYNCASSSIDLACRMPPVRRRAFALPRWRSDGGVIGGPAGLAPTWRTTVSIRFSQVGVSP